MEQLSSFVLASILLTLSPGPDLLMVIAKSLEKGVTTALYFIAGLVSGLCAHTFLLILGWPQLIGEHPAVVMGMKIVGGVYFSYLGIVLLNSKGMFLKHQEYVHNLKLLLIYF